MTLYLYGLHMMMDGPLVAVPDEHLATSVILSAIRLAQMELIRGPRYYRDGPHVSCIAILAESHCLVHVMSYETGVYGFFDLFSCRRFQPAPIVAMVKERLGMVPRDYRLLRRTDCPDSGAALWRVPIT